MSESVNNKAHCDKTQISDEICHISDHYSELHVTLIGIIRLEISNPEILNSKCLLPTPTTHSNVLPGSCQTG